MKKLIFLAMMLISVNSHGCANLSGEYSCSSAELTEAFPYQITVDHTDDFYTETLHVENGEDVVDTFKLDGRNHRSYFGIKYKAICENKENLEIDYKLFLIKSWTKYVKNDKGFIVYRKTSKKDDFKIFHTCKIN